MVHNGSNGYVTYSDIHMWHMWEKWGNFQVPAQEWKEKYSIECERRRKLLVFRTVAAKLLCRCFKFQGVLMVLWSYSTFWSVAGSVPKKGSVNRQQNTVFAVPLQICRDLQPSSLQFPAPGCTIWCRNWKADLCAWAKSGKSAYWAPKLGISLWG